MISVQKIILNKGFTLAEIIIALSIIGIISTFNIVKLQNSVINAKYKAMAKEAASIITQGYTAFKMSNIPNTSTTPKSLLPYFLGVKYLDSTVTLTSPSGATFTCYNATNGDENCVQLANGGVLSLDNRPFIDTTSTSLIWFGFDPDGGGPAESMALVLYYGGRVVDEGNLVPGSHSGWGSHGAWPFNVPSWFSWN